MWKLRGEGRRVMLEETRDRKWESGDGRGLYKGKVENRGCWLEETGERLEEI
jgi:hypothetical protein